MTIILYTVLTIWQKFNQRWPFGFERLTNNQKLVRVKCHRESFHPNRFACQTDTDVAGPVWDAGGTPLYSTQCGTHGTLWHTIETHYMAHNASQQGAFRGHGVCVYLHFGRAWKKHISHSILRPIQFHSALHVSQYVFFNVFPAMC